MGRNSQGKPNFQEFLLAVSFWQCTSKLVNPRVAWSRRIRPSGDPTQQLEIGDLDDLLADFWSRPEVTWKSWNRILPLWIEGFVVLFYLVINPEGWVFWNQGFCSIWLFTMIWQEPCYVGRFKWILWPLEDTNALLLQMLSTFPNRRTGRYPFLLGVKPDDVPKGVKVELVRIKDPKFGWKCFTLAGKIIQQVLIHWEHVQSLFATLELLNNRSSQGILLVISELPTYLSHPS